MIARMSKYDFVLFAAQSADFVDRLRDLGLVDITTAGWEPSEEDRQLLLDIEAGTKALDFLKAWAGESGHKQTGAQPYASGEETFRQYAAAQRALAASRTEIARLEKSAEELRPWGEFDVARVQKLAGQGIVLRYFSAQRNTYDKMSAEWSEQYAVSEINRTDSTVWFIVVAAPGQEINLDAQEMKTPQMDVRQAGEAIAAEQAKVEKSWRQSHKELAHKLDKFLKGELPEIDYKAVDMKADVATRAASATVLSLYGEKVENMIVASADLSNSDKTDGFLKKTKAFTKGDFSGKFFQAGVSELTMACVMNGMALHGGVIPACGTFFVFSDYMKPAVRLAALMRLHVVYIWTHDSFRVGEDGPTHQPIEHEAQIRLMEHLKNHHGERSMVVLRPADGEETLMAWKTAIEEHRPVALVLSRQNIKNLPTLSSKTRREEAAQVSKGGYVVMDAAKPAAVLVATGSEVATLVEGAELLAREGIAVRVVNVPSEGLFRDQPKSYQESVLPAGIVRYGLTSGLPVNLLGLVGDSGFIHGLDHFGFSAPYKVLDEKFGFNGETVAAEVKNLLKKK